MGMAFNMQINKNFPGGNINVIDISSNKIKLEQEIRDTTEWWFYWSFCVENPDAGDYLFEFTNGEVVGPWGPAISFDRITWDWSFSALSRTAFKYTFTGLEKKVYFSFSLPYQLDDFKRRLCGKNDKIEVTRLTKSERGLSVPLLKFGNGIKNIFFTARSHACESVANYVLEGVIFCLLLPENEALLKDYTFHVIPFLDIDGVENGDQGKCRDPYDHNRDYTDRPIYNSIKALIDYSNAHKPDIYVDFHCPGPGFHRYSSGSDRDNYPHFVKSQPLVKKQVEKLGTLLNEVTVYNKHSDAIVYSPEHDIDIGVDWLIEEEMNGSSCSFFVSRGCSLAVILEIPYFGTKDCVYTQDNTFNFGVDFGKAFMKLI